MTEEDEILKLYIEESERWAQVEEDCSFTGLVHGTGVPKANYYIAIELHKLNKNIEKYGSLIEKFMQK